MGKDRSLVTLCTRRELRGAPIGPPVVPWIDRPQSVNQVNPNIELSYGVDGV